MSWCWWYEDGASDEVHQVLIAINEHKLFFWYMNLNTSKLWCNTFAFPVITVFKCYMFNAFSVLIFKKDKVNAAISAYFADWRVTGEGFFTCSAAIFHKSTQIFFSLTLWAFWGFLLQIFFYIKFVIICCNIYLYYILFRAYMYEGHLMWCP